MLEGLTFLSPWVLLALMVVPLLWWLLRVMPPRPKVIRFPAFFLLKGLQTTLKSAAKTPWWLLLLRSLMVVCLVVALADPVLYQSEDLPGGKEGEVLILVDNGWAAATDWEKRKEKLKDYLQQLRRTGRSIIILPTAPSAEDGKVSFYGPMLPDKADEWINRFKPHPWPADYKGTLGVLSEVLRKYQVTYSLFLSDGLQVPKKILKRIDRIVMDKQANNPYLLKQAIRENSSISEFLISRLQPLPEKETVQVFAYGEDGRVLDRQKIVFPAKKLEYRFSWNILPELRNKIRRLSLDKPTTAASVFLTSAEWSQHTVGIIADPSEKEQRNFLSEVYYLRRALEEGQDVKINNLTPLLKENVSALVLPDTTILTETEKWNLLEWVEKGGLLLRFAGPNLAADSDDGLLPVELHHGLRAMQGSMTWEKPLSLADISDKSLLYGLTVPKDIKVTRQVLAEPAPESFEKTWMHLEDGTPFITGDRMGKGMIVLVHTTAGPNWSSFCFSGLYVEFLKKIVSFSRGIEAGYKPQLDLAPRVLLDGFGREAKINQQSFVKPIQPGQVFTPSPSTPPGIYGAEHEYRVFNLPDYLLELKALNGLPLHISVDSYQKGEERSLKSFFIQALLFLFLLETLLTLRLRGIISFLLFISFMFLSSVPSFAKEVTPSLLSKIHLGYIKTGDATIDRLSYHGLMALAETVSLRTTTKIKDVVSLDPEKDILSFYPFIYWPMTDQQLPLSEQAARRIQTYLSQGGLILFDTRDGQFKNNGTTSTPGIRQLRRITRDLQIPELIKIPKDHILTRSFYLLDRFPGRYAGGTVWVEKDPSTQHDSVTSVIIGNNDWAAAWSKDTSDRARYIMDVGGDRQREMAYRFGVNMIMMALTGNYKGDQIHIPYILGRIGE